MSATVTGHQTSIAGVGSTSNNFTFSVTAGSNFLLVIETGHWGNPAASASPAIMMTVNGVGMNLLPSSFVQQTFSQAAIWYMPNPPMGSVTIASQYPTTQNLQYCLQGAISFSGVNTGQPFYQPATTSASGSSANQSISTGSSITANDLYLAVYQALSTTSTSGSGQTTVWDINTSDAALEQKVDTIPGSTPNPTFVFTSTSNNGNTNNSVAVALQIMGTPADSANGMVLGLPVGSAGMTQVAWVQTIPGWMGATTAVSSSVTATPGDAVVFWGGTQFAGDLITLAASIDGSVNYVPGNGQPYAAVVGAGMRAAWWRYDVSASAQTYTITSPFSSTGLVGLGWEYSNVGFVEISSFWSLSPGAAAGALTTGPIVVPDHGILLSIAVDNNQTTNVISNVNGTQRGVGSIQAGSGAFPITYCAAEFQGTGAPITPQFTTTIGTDNYLIYNYLLHPNNTSSAGWNASAMNTFLSSNLGAIQPTIAVTLLGTQSLDDGGSAFFVTKSFNITVPVGTTCVVYCHGSADGSGGAYCTSCSLNGSSFTTVSGTQVDSGGTYFGSSIHYLFSPTIGTSTFTVNVATNVNANGNTFYAPTFLYFNNVSSLGGGVTNASTNGNVATVTVTGISSSNDLYIATASIYAQTGSTLGANNQFVSHQTMANGGTTTENEVASITGNNAGSFSFTGTGGSLGNAYTIAGCWIHH